MSCNETYISSKLLLFDRLILRSFRGFVRCNHLTGKQIARTRYLVTNCLIASAAFRRHAGEDRHPHVGIIIYDHFTLGVVETMQPAGILSEGTFPSNWHGKKKGIEAGIIETLAEVTSGCEIIDYH